MSTLTTKHRIARLVGFPGSPSLDDSILEFPDDDVRADFSSTRTTFKIDTLVPSNTTQSWMENRFTWFQKQQFTLAHEYAHFYVHLLGERYPQDVLEFSAANGLADKLDIAVELVNQTFPDAKSVHVGMEQDPDADHRWIMVDALVQGNAKEIRLRHRECVRRLLKLLPWPVSALIRTNYTLA